MTSAVTPSAVPYCLAYPSSQGECYEVKGKAYFFEYSKFPHGHLDCNLGSIEFNRELCDKVEKEREKIFFNFEQGAGSRGIYTYTKTSRSIFQNYTLTLSKFGELSKKNY